MSFVEYSYSGESVDEGQDRRTADVPAASASAPAAAVDTDAPFTQLVKVHISGGRFVGLPVSESTTFAQLRLRVQRRLGLGDVAGRFFDVLPVICGCEHRPRTYLHESGSKATQLGSELKVLASIRTFAKIGEKQLAAKPALVPRTGQTFLRYAKWSFDKLAELRIAADPVGLRLLYEEAFAAHLRYLPYASAEEALRTAAMHLFVRFGAYTPAVHRRRFLLQHNLLSAYLPAHILATGKSAEQEDTLMAGYAQLAFASVDEAMRAALQHMRKIRMYGGLASHPCRAQTPKGVVAGRLIIVVSTSSIGFVTEHGRHLVGSYPFDRIKTWGSDDAKHIWWIELLTKAEHELIKAGTHALHKQHAKLVRSDSGEVVQSVPGAQPEPQDIFYFQTTQVHLLNAALHRATLQQRAWRALSAKRPGRVHAHTHEPAPVPARVPAFPAARPAARPAGADGFAEIDEEAYEFSDDEPIVAAATVAPARVGVDDAFDCWDSYESYSADTGDAQAPAAATK